MIKKLIALFFVTLILQSFKTADIFIKKNTNITSVEDYYKIKNSILPNVSNALALGDSNVLLKQDIFFEVSQSKYNDFCFKKWNNVNFEIFYLAYKGYNVLLNEGIISNRRYLTIINYEISSNKKRMWVLDMLKNKVIIHDLVSHGRNSGEEYAHFFSNSPESFKSSLGFYVTGMPYLGKNNYSLKLHGVEENINDNAFERGIVIHGADYVSHKFIRNHKRLGRSQGCPAVSEKLNPWLINTIQGGSCLFVYYPSEKYLKKSPVLNSDF